LPYILLVRLVERRPANKLALGRAPAELATGLILGVLMMSAVMAALVGSELYQLTGNGPQPVWKAAGAAFEAGIVEEVIVRGIILRLLWRAFGAPVAFVGSAAVFGLSRIGNAEASVFAALCIAVEAGVMLGAFYALTGRLWVSIGLHVAWNFTQGHVFGAAVSGQTLGASFATSTASPGYPAWLTGGAFGPEASLPALIVGGVVGLAALWSAWKNGRFAPEGPARHATAATRYAVG
jgi:membrane protease YdiL (CAAX protease family)